MSAMEPQSSTVSVPQLKGCEVGPSPQSRGPQSQRSGPQSKSAVPKLRGLRSVAVRGIRESEGTGVREGGAPADLRVDLMMGAVSARSNASFVS